MLATSHLFLMVQLLTFIVKRINLLFPFHGWDGCQVVTYLSDLMQRLVIACECRYVISLSSRKSTQLAIVGSTLFAGHCSLIMKHFKYIRIKMQFQLVILLCARVLAFPMKC